MLESLAADLALRNVRFVGRVPSHEMGALYGDADLFVNWWTSTTLPLSILDAFAAGVPVVTTDAGGIPPRRPRRRDGIPRPRGDDAALADRLLRLLGDSDLASRTAANARAECLARYLAGGTPRMGSALPRARGKGYGVPRRGGSGSVDVGDLGQALLRRLGKLRGRSVAELRERAGQMLSAELEYRGLARTVGAVSPTSLVHRLNERLLGAATHDAAALRAHFAERTSPPFFAGVRDGSSARALDEPRWATERAHLIAAADRILEASTTCSATKGSRTDIRSTGTSTR